MKTLISLIGVMVLSTSMTLNLQTGILSGLITDSSTGNAISNALVEVFQSGKNISSNSTGSNGVFSLSLNQGTYSVKVTAQGYDIFVNKKVNITSGTTTNLKISLKPSTIVDSLTASDEIVVEEKKEMFATGMAMSSRAKSEGYANYAPPSVVSYQPQEFNTESYDVISENGFKDVINNPLSTFSIDVDKASYSNIRRFLTQNQKPVKDAVRIEEMINYFDYEYPQPTNGHPFSITIEGDKCPWNEKHNLVLVGLKGENLNDKQIPPSNLVFLLDVSGSMDEPNKLPLIKRSFKYLVENLRSVDKVAIVVYAGAAGVVLESTQGNMKETIIASIDKLQAGGSTAGGEGINLAYSIAKQNFIKGGNNRVILATDGDFNIGASSDAEMVRLIEEKRKDGIFLSVLGVGMGNYKDSKMEKIADAGNGNYSYIDNLLEAKKVFGTELWGTLYTIAKDVKIQIEFNPSKVKAYRLIGYENRLLNKEDFNDDKKDAGEIGCGHTVTALYEIIPSDSEENISNVDPLEYQKQSIVSESKNMMTVKVRYKKPDEDVSKLIVEKVETGKTKISNNIRFASAVAEFGMLLRESEFKGTSSYETVLKRAKGSAGLDEFGYRADFIKMVELSEMLDK
ncbi:MAG: von Willebrand factor type A domain-containing protein [Bacteroidales bacterium]|nr:von Willebrand factor type A domain-containing protein [Bacteroidales bacterium]